MDQNRIDSATAADAAQPTRLTRRQLLRGLAVTAAASVVGPILAACGQTAQAPAAPTTAPAAPPKAAAPTTAPAAPTAAPTAVPKAAATAAPAAAAAPTAAPKAVAKAGGKVVWAMPTDPTCLAPFGILPGAAHEGKELMYDSLVAWDRNLAVVPALAESWTTPDDKTYLFKLRQGVKFHSGKELDAEDVKYSVEMQSGKSLPPPGAPIGQYPKIDTVEAVDKYTVKLNMKGPDPTVIGWFAWTRWSSITSKGFYDSGNPCTTANGTGPFKLVEFVANDRVVMTKFADHWKKGTPYLDEVTLKIMPDESARVAALRSGAIDGCDVTGDTARTLRNDPNITIVKGLTSSPRVLQFSVKGEGKPWEKKAVRQAMSMGINRQELIDKVYGGEAELTGNIPPGYGEWVLPNDRLKTIFKYDLEGAKKLLADAGHKDGFEISLHTVPNDYQQMAEVVKEHMKKLNIEVKIVIEEIGTFAKRFNEGTFEWFLNGFGMRHDPTGYVNWISQPTVAQGKVWFNEGKGWKNDEMSKLFDQVSVTLDQKARVPMIHKIQEIALDEAIHVFLCQPYKFTATRKRVKDMYVSFTDFRPGLREVWLDG